MHSWGEGFFFSRIAGRTAGRVTLMVCPVEKRGPILGPAEPHAFPGYFLVSNTLSLQISHPTSQNPQTSRGEKPTQCTTNLANSVWVSFLTQKGKPLIKQAAKNPKLKPTTKPHPSDPPRPATLYREGPWPGNLNGDCPQLGAMFCGRESSPRPGTL